MFKPISIFAFVLLTFAMADRALAQEDETPGTGGLEASDQEPAPQVEPEAEPEPAPEPEPEAEPEPVLDEPFVPGYDEPVIEDEDDGYEDYPMEDMEPLDVGPYGKGDMGLSLMIGAGGAGSYFTLSLGGSFEYFVVPRLAPGLMLIYSATWGELEYPQSLWTMPFLKFVLIRSHKFAPYIIAGGGRDFQWGGTDDPSKGYAAVSSWFGGPGGGAHIGLGAHVRLNLLIMAIYQKFDEKVILMGENDATDSRWYPLWSIGLSFVF